MYFTLLSLFAGDLRSATPIGHFAVADHRQIFTLGRCMTLRIRAPWSKIIVSSVMSEQVRLPTPPPPSPSLAEPPRKRRRRKAKQDSFVVPLEARNPGLFEKCDWIIDGPYRRVPPYFYVDSTLFLG